MGLLHDEEPLSRRHMKGKEKEVSFNWGQVTGTIRGRRGRDGRIYHTIILDGSLQRDWGKAGYFKVRELSALVFVLWHIRFYLWLRRVRF